MKPIIVSAGVLACACLTFAILFAYNGLWKFAAAAVIECACTVGLAIVTNYPTTRKDRVR